MNKLYSNLVFKHFRNPKNLGVIKKPDSQAQVGNPICGDVMKMYLKIAKKSQGEEFIKDIKFQTLGCAAAIATSSMTTETAKGMSLKKALDINKKLIADKLGGLPKEKLHCSMLAVEALHKAIKNYQNKKGKK
ncbi:iron-sulfur cluster assembly scaffold protein [Patescibacteria group bacterium]